MNSAFGIDHGEVSKASRQQRKAKKATNAALAAQKAANNAKMRGHLSAVAGFPKKAAHTRVSIADVGSAAGKAVGAVGRIGNKAPAATGTALLAGGGYGGYKFSQRRAKKSVKQ